MKTDLSDHLVVITGGAGGLGRAVVRRFARAGASCWLPMLDSDPDPGFEPEVAARVEMVRGVDLTDEPAVAAFYRSLPGLWASVHLAGGFAMSPIAATGLDDLAAQWRLNAVTAFLCSREAVARLRTNPDRPDGRGRIVNVAARPALEPRSGARMIAYTMAKAAVAALTEALAEEVRSEGIWVNAIVPSIIDTPANRRAMPDADHSAWPSPEAIAETLAFLVSPANAVTRGGLVPVYGRS